jgi:hypothetical protein
MDRRIFGGGGPITAIGDGESTLWLRKISNNNGTVYNKPIKKICVKILLFCWFLWKLSVISLFFENNNYRIKIWQQFRYSHDLLLAQKQTIIYSAQKF